MNTSVAPAPDASGAPDQGVVGTDAGIDGGTALDGASPADDAGGNDDAGASNEDLSVRQVAASETDPGIDDVLGVHQVAVGPAADRRGRLLVFYPGTTATPQDYERFIERGARLGYHALGLAYINEIPVNVLCAGMGATDCHERVRREILLGSDETNLVDVDTDNSAINRLQRLLDYLEATAPDEGWSAFRRDGQLEWSSIVVAGHSQGAGHAAFTARLWSVQRALLFSGTEPVTWTTATDFATPADRFFGFVHRLEPIFSPIVRSWSNIGLPGTLTTVDGVEPPYGGAHQLTTAFAACTGDPESNGFYHNCHIADAWMPYLADGTPRFQAAWDYLLAQ